MTTVYTSREVKARTMMGKRYMRAISVLRMYIGCSGVIIACWLVRLVEYPEHEGYQMGFIVGVFSGLALIDTVINDIMPRDFVSEITKRWRNIGFMLLGLSYACTLFFLFQYVFPPYLLILRILLDAFACATIAFAGIGETADEESMKPRRTHYK